jgi:hypothetical protein
VVHLLSNSRFEGYDVIVELARARALIVLAFEGVVVPGVGLTSDPERTDPESRALIRSLAQLYPCAVVTHQATSVVTGCLEDVPLQVIGGPTVERRSAVEAFARGFPPWPVAFVGSEEEDEEVFRAPFVTHAIRVGTRVGSTAAHQFISDRVELDAFVSKLVTERARLAGLGGGWQDLEGRRSSEPAAKQRLSCRK